MPIRPCVDKSSAPETPPDPHPPHFFLVPSGGYVLTNMDERFSLLVFEAYRYFWELVSIRCPSVISLLKVCSDEHPYIATALFLGVPVLAGVIGSDGC